MDVSTRVADVLSKNPMLLASPSGGQLGGDLYANAQNSTVELAKRQCYTGRYKASANNLALGGVSSFVLNPGSIISECYVVASIALPQHARAPDGWLLSAVQQVQIQMSGSSAIQSQQLSGRAHMDAALMFCASEEKRNCILQASPAFNLTGAGATVTGAMPLILPWSSTESQGAFSLDSGTLKSQVIINITWKPAYQWLSGSTGNAITVPTAFSELYMRCVQTDLLEGQFLTQALRLDDSMIYSIPAKYMQFFEQTTVLTHGSEQQISLTSMPAGMLQAILISCVPEAWVGTSGTVQYVNDVVSIPLAKLRMLYNGQEIYRFDAAVEEDLVATLQTDGSCAGFECLNTISVAAAATNGLFKSKIHMVNFAHEISSVLRGRHMENTPSYSGSTLQLFIQPSTTIPYNTDSITRSTLATPTGSNYIVTCTYILNSLMEISNTNTTLEL